MQRWLAFNMHPTVHYLRASFEGSFRSISGRHFGTHWDHGSRQGARFAGCSSYFSASIGSQDFFAFHLAPSERLRLHRPDAAKRPNIKRADRDSEALDTLRRCDLVVNRELVLTAFTSFVLHSGPVLVRQTLALGRSSLSAGEGACVNGTRLIVIRRKTKGTVDTLAFDA